MLKKIALVTGSTSGIGLGIARSLAKKGCPVVLTGFADDSLVKDLKTEFKESYNVQADYVPADLTKVSDVQALCDNVTKIHSQGVDILVNNAGFQHVSPVEDFPSEVWDGMVSVMLTAPFTLTKHLLPHMRRKNWGRIINISSVHGLKASPNKSAYIACKHGIVGFTKVVALETAGSGVTCNAICPGYVDTPILQGQVQSLAERENLTIDEARKKFLSSFHPSGSPVAIEHLGDAVCFLCTDSASQMTGSSMVIDGGWASK